MRASPSQPAACMLTGLGRWAETPHCLVFPCTEISQSPDESVAGKSGAEQHGWAMLGRRLPNPAPQLPLFCLPRVLQARLAHEQHFSTGGAAPAALPLGFKFPALSGSWAFGDSTRDAWGRRASLCLSCSWTACCKLGSFLGRRAGLCGRILVLAVVGRVGTKLCGAPAAQAS